MSPGRALIVVENLSVPFDRRVWQECKALQESGFEVAVICPCGQKQDRERYQNIDGIEIHRYPLRPVTKGLGAYAGEYGSALWHSLRLSLKLGRFDIVHVCNPPDLLFLVALPHKLRGARLIFDQHDLVPELYTSRFGRSGDPMHRVMLLLEKITYRLADVVLATNESYMAKAVERGGVTPSRVFVVRSAPDLERFKRVAPDPSLKRGKRYLICYLGVMGPQDGVDYGLKALASLRDRREQDDWHATFVGSGDAYDEMVELAGTLELNDRVDFTGRISDEDLLAYLCTADLGLAPDPLNPLNDISTMNKILEYMAVGLPLVSFDLTEARVSAGDAGLYATPNDTDELGLLIERMLDDEPDRHRRGEIGRERVAKELSWRHSKRELLSAYSHAMGLRRAVAEAPSA